MPDEQRVLDAIREMISAAEETGWDSEDGLREILQGGRDAYAALQTILIPTDEADA